METDLFSIEKSKCVGQKVVLICARNVAKSFFCVALVLDVEKRFMGHEEPHSLISALIEKICYVYK